jgi:hypothetical protein
MDVTIGMRDKVSVIKEKKAKDRALMVENAILGYAMLKVWAEDESKLEVVLKFQVYCQACNLGNSLNTTTTRIAGLVYTY